MRHLAVLLFALIALDVGAQWAREGDLCVRETGETFETGYNSRSYITAICSALNKVEVWVGGALEAQILNRGTIGGIPTGEGPGGIPGGDPPDDGENSAPLWSITDQLLENGEAYSLTLTTVNSDADADARVFTVEAGTLPTGLTLSNGVISGTPTVDGDSVVTLGANDGGAVVLCPQITTSAALSFSSCAFTPPQNGIFTAFFPVTPIASNIDLVCGYGEVTASGYANLFAAVRFNPAGNIDARDNAVYTADNAKAYSGSTAYSIVMTFNVPAGTYDVSADATVIGDDFVMRGGAMPDTLGYITCVDAASPGTVGSIAGPFQLQQPVIASVTFSVFTPDVNPPDAPSAPTITGVTQTTVSMTLPASMAADHANYDIYRSPSGCGSYALIQDAYTASTYTDTGLTSNTGYCYRLVDVDTSSLESAASADATATTAAVDIDALLSINDVSQNEADASSANFTFTLTASSSQSFNIVCDWSTQSGTADSATDYTAGSGTVQIDAGMTTASIAVSVNGDTDDEANETFQVVVGNCGSGAPSAHATQHIGTGTIINDDDPTPAGLSVSNASLAEGDSGLATLNFTVTLSPASGSDVTFEYYTVNGTATAWSDYVAVSGVGILRAGETTFVVSVPLIGDTVAEGSETFTLRLANQGVVP